MPINNTPKPTGSVNNTSKVSNSVTWNTWTVSWATETRTWDELISTMDNTQLLGEPLWSYRNYPWQLTAPWQETHIGITNTSKP
jgi:hypothetical protein